MSISTAGEGTQHHRGANQDLVPPHDPDGPSQIQSLLDHLPSAEIFGGLLSPPSDALNGTACRETAAFGGLAASMNSSLVASGVSGAQRPVPRRVKAGTRRPRPGEYQPRMGSVSPRCRDHRSTDGSSSRATPGEESPGQRRTASDPSSSASTSGPR